MSIVEYASQRVEYSICYGTMTLIKLRNNKILCGGTTNAFRVKQDKLFQRRKSTMKRKLVILMAISLFAAAAPVLAEEVQQHGASHQPQDEQCAKECAMLLRNCAQEVDGIQDRIRKLKVALDEKGATTYTLEELKILKKKLKEANDQLTILQAP
jgi:hypothetical protein